jgi:hypothetical protein
LLLLRLRLHTCRRSCLLLLLHWRLRACQSSCLLLLLLLLR